MFIVQVEPARWFTVLAMSASDPISMKALRATGSDLIGLGPERAALPSN